jgi:hypothetical protein
MGSQAVLGVLLSVFALAVKAFPANMKKAKRVAVQKGFLCIKAPVAWVMSDLRSH